MNYKLVSVCTNSQGIDAVTGRLYTVGVEGVEIKDEENCVFIKTCIECNDETEKMLKSIKETIDELKDYDKEKMFGSLQITLKDTCDDDFMNTWKQYYKPTKIGNNLVIVPEWEDYSPKESEVIIKMEPKYAFGSGTHETTSLCMEFIEEFCNNMKCPVKNLDIGTGTGILAITSLKLGAESSVGIDIDNEAVNTSILNAELNGVSEKFKGICGNLADEIHGKYNLVTANIVADAIISLSKDVGNILSDDGVFIASGIISSREKDVLKSLEANNLSVVNKKHKNDWVSLLIKKDNL